MLSRKKVSAAPYSRKVKELRLNLSLTQHNLAELLHVRPQVVASWEQGRKEPSARSYQQLARLAPLEQAKFFLSRMGMTPELMRKLAPQPAPLSPEIRICTSEQWKEGSQQGLRYQVQIPVLHDEAAACSPRKIHERDVDCFIAVPERAVPKGPAAYTGIYVRGDSMEPVLRGGFIVVLDHTHRDTLSLRGRLVAALVDGAVFVKLLARESQADRLVLRSYNSEYADILMHSPRTSPIIGDVVFWWGSQGS